jgi:H+/Cl- antiporter ClcA
MRTREFRALIVLAGLLGVVTSLLAWGFLELVFHMQGWVFDDLPGALGYDSTPVWWPLPILALAGVLVALVIDRLPGNGGHVPAEGLKTSPTQPIALPGVILAGIATIGLGLVLGPEAPLMALGGGLGLLAIRIVRPGASDEAGQVLAAASTLSALAFLFGSPIVAALILIEAAGLGGKRLPIVLVPGLFAAAIGSLMWIGMGTWTGLDTSAISIGALKLPSFPRPDIVDFGWTILLAIVIAVVTFMIFRVAQRTHRLTLPRPLLVLPALGLAVAGLAILFSQVADKDVSYALFSGETSIDPLVENPGAWPLWVLALLIGCKGLAYAFSLGGFRGGPVFPALFLGAAGGMMAAGLPGFALTPAVAVGLGASVAAVLRLPLSAAALGVFLTLPAGAGSSPLIIVGVVVAYLTTLALSARLGAAPAPAY